MMQNICPPVSSIIHYQHLLILSLLILWVLACHDKNSFPLRSGVPALKDSHEDTWETETAGRIRTLLADSH